MTRRRRPAEPKRMCFIVEEEEYDEELTGDSWLLGTFDAHTEIGVDAGESVEGLTADEAIAWGRARAERVWIRLGDDHRHFAVHEEIEDDDEAWPPPDLPELTRRRPPREAWRDRTEADEAIEWVAEVHLAPEPWPQAGVPIDDLEKVEEAFAVGAGVTRPRRKRGVRRGITVERHGGLAVRVMARTREEAAERARSCGPVPGGWVAKAYLSGVRPA